MLTLTLIALAFGAGYVLPRPQWAAGVYERLRSYLRSL